MSKVVGISMAYVIERALYELGPFEAKLHLRDGQEWREKITGLYDHGEGMYVVLDSPNNILVQSIEWIEYEYIVFGHDWDAPWSTEDPIDKRLFRARH